MSWYTSWNDYNAHVMASRLFYYTAIPRIDGRTGVNGLPHVFDWQQYPHMLGMN